MGCSGCGFENPAGFKFCGACGSPLSGGTVVGPAGVASGRSTGLAAGSSPDGPTGERRQLTVMFCDLVGSTALSEQLDPEDLREVLIAYQDACGQVISRFGGYIARYLGDGLLVYFGYPRAHEDDAQRAVRAGLAIVEEIARLDAHLRSEKGIALAARLAVHTGLVVVGEIGAADQRETMAIVGETPNVAARLQNLAEPNTLVMSAATHRLVEGFFVCDDLGAHELRGISLPVTVYRVLRDSGARSRLDVSSASGQTPLVGRAHEVEMLRERWERAKAGDGQVALLGGEPGIGKSRLVQVLVERIAPEPRLLLECRCSPYQQNTALHPVVEMLEGACGFSPHNAAEENQARLTGLLGRHGLASSETRWLLSSLLGVPFPDADAPPALTSEQQRRRLLEAVLRLVLALAGEQPVLLVVEDLHWVDASTLELLDLIVGRAQTAPIFVILSFRSEFSPPWPLRAHMVQMTLSRLPRKEAESIIGRVAGGKRLPDAVVQQLVTRTDGIPLFVEELTKTVLEMGVLEEHDDRFELRGPLPALAIPATLQDSLLARLDRLGGAREVAQWGAALGREFTYELLQAVSALDERMLQRELGRLVGAELLYLQEAPPRTAYVFKHALIQAAAYESLLKSRRRQYHRRIAQTLTERFPEIGAADPATLARHYTEAGLTVQAVQYWQRAGQWASEHSANAEAIGHLTTGLDLLRTLPEDPERLHLELNVLTALGPVLMPTNGYGSPEVEAVYTRALAICRQLGESSQLFPVVRGLWEFSEVSGDMATAREMAEELLRLASAADDTGLLLVAEDALGETLAYLGEVRLAHEHFERGIALYDPEQHRSLAHLYGGYDVGIICRVWSAFTLWCLGSPEQALGRCHEALALAHQFAHPTTLAFALSIAGLLHQARRDAQATREAAEAVIALSEDQGFTFWAAFAAIQRGWALSSQGQVREGLAQIRRGLAAWEATGAVVERPLWLAVLAEACARAGAVEEGLAALAEGLAVTHEHGIRFYEAELLRLRGELLLMQTEPDEQQAVRAFREAIQVARAQHATSFELRAATSLGRLLRT